MVADARYCFEYQSCFEVREAMMHRPVKTPVRRP